MNCTLLFQLESRGVLLSDQRKKIEEVQDLEEGGAPPPSPLYVPSGQEHVKLVDAAMYDCQRDNLSNLRRRST